MNRYASTLLALLPWGWFILGCNGPSQQIEILNKQILSLQRDNRKLVITAERQDQEIDKLKEVISDLLEMGKTRVDKLYAVSRIAIGRLSGGSDSDGAIGDEGMTIYLQLYDQDDHLFKAAGSITVRVFDLYDPDEPALIAKCEYDADQAKKRWFGRLLTYHYKIECSWADQAPQGRRVFVMASFLDYLTGRVHQDSKEFHITPPLNAQANGSARAKDR